MSAKMRVEYIDSMGSDLTVVNDARVSFDKHGAWAIDENGHQTRNLVPKDVRLVEYLARKGHWSPFAQVELKVRCEAPLFVARQMWKSHVGATGGDAGYPAWNEVSRRYVDDEPEFYFPEIWRGRPENKKQGSTGVIEGQQAATGIAAVAVREAVKAYHDLLKRGVAPEQARMVLPQNMVTSWVWKGSLYFFARVAELRDAEDAQGESQELARLIGGHAARVAPVSWAALRKPWNETEVRYATLRLALAMLDESEGDMDFLRRSLLERLPEGGGQ